ncbi:MAG TPA: protoporphyrinogen oxidase [Ilumatobacter sp.]
MNAAIGGASRRRVLVVGGGIAGLAAAVELVDIPGTDVELWEATDRLGGKIATSPFAGLAHVDEAADAYLTRVPQAVAFARRVGLADGDLTAPAAARAMVWHDRLHDIPGGIVLGVPAAIGPFATTSLLSWKGKLRAAVEPLLPRTDADDSLGRHVRARFGDEVHDRLVDSLVGSIYATDTDRSSLAAVPQLHALATGHRSLLLGAIAARRRAAAASFDGAVFEAPRQGMAALVAAAADYAVRRGASVVTGRAVTEFAADGDGWRADGQRFDAVVLATPARPTAPLLAAALPDVAAALAGFEHADVTMVRLTVPGADWPYRLVGRSGYLVPKPDQRYVTAASFASQKWAHWGPPDGSQLLRVSLGRDGLPVAHLDDDAVVAATVAETGRHLGFDLQPEAISITRWADAFPQYRPHHARRVAAIEAQLPPTVALAGASFHGIGIPACIAGAQRAAGRVIAAIKPVTAPADEGMA